MGQLVRGLTEHEAGVLRLALDAVTRGTGYPNMEPRDWPVMQALRVRGCLAVIVDDDDFQWLGITDLGRLALRVHGLPAAGVERGSTA